MRSLFCKRLVACLCMKQKLSETPELDESEMRHDWIFAAAVLHRIFAITFSAILVGGTLVFFVLFAVHP